MSEDVPGKSWQDDDGLHVDTRGLEPPGPMVAILSALENAGQTKPVIAYLDRYPVHLFPELAERGCQWDVERHASGAVTLTLRPGP